MKNEIINKLERLRYERTEVERLCDYLKNNLEDFNKFAKFIANYLKK